GETPSPQMVAAAGATEGVRPRLALGLFAVVLVGLVSYVFIAARYKVQNLTALPKPPEVLLARAQEVIQQLGFADQPSDTAYGFLPDAAYLDYIQSSDKSRTRWQRLADDRPATILFWYRQSPRELVSLNFFTSAGAGLVTPNEPPSDVTGMTSVWLDAQ